MTHSHKLLFFPASLPVVDEEKDWTPIIIGVVIAVIVILIAIAILIAFCVVKKRKADQKKSAPSSNGHINPVMTRYIINLLDEPLSSKF